VAYRVEPAKSKMSSCKACKMKIEKGDLRFGSMVDIGGHGTFHWRHLSCISVKQAANVVSKAGGAEAMDGYAELPAKQQAAFRKAFDIAKEGKTPAAKAAAKSKAALAKAKAKIAAAKAKVKALALKAKAKMLAAKVKAKAKAKGKGKAKAKAKAAVGSGRCAPPSVAEQHAFLDAAKRYDFRTVRNLVSENHHYTNAQPDMRWTALHQAAAAGHVETIKFLLERGASLDVETKDGKKPFDVAKPSCKHLLAPDEEPAAPAKRGRVAVEAGGDDA